MRRLLKAIIPNRALVAIRIALSPELSKVPLVAVPSVSGIIKSLMLYGYGRSISENAPVDAEGHPIPWYTYPMIEYLESLDLSDLTIFEYGCGNSSLWWAKHAKKVVSVEDNREWYNKISSTLPGNASVILAEDRAAYVNTIDSSFDLIIVDGSVRYQCCLKAVDHLSPGGAIILDNADCLPRCTAFLRKADLFEVAMNGVLPLAVRGGRTSIFISQPTRLKFKNHRSAVAGADEQWETDQERSL